MARRYTHHGNVQHAAIDDVKRVHAIAKGAEVFERCALIDCPATARTETLYHITFKKPKYVASYSMKSQRWTFCKRHLPEKIKDAPQIKIALFAARAKGRG